MPRPAEYEGLDAHDYVAYAEIEMYANPEKRAKCEALAFKAFAEHGKEHEARGEPGEEIMPESITMGWTEQKLRGHVVMMLHAIGYCSCKKAKTP